MKVSEIMKERMSVSFEVFPPKMDKPVEPLFETIEKLYGFEPDFISCTYGAGGTNKGRQSEILKYLADGGRTVPVAHYTCIGNSREDILGLVREYRRLGIGSFLALRGDFPQGWEGTGGAFDYGCQLIAFLRENFPELELAGGCYPEKHLKAANMAQEIAILKLKQDAGADFFMAQLCHDIDNFCRYREMAARAGVTAPIDFGLMPVLAKDATLRMALSNGCSIPKELAEVIGKYGEDPDAFKEAGKEFTVRQIERLRAEGVAGIHIYTLNRFRDVADIVKASGLRAYTAPSKPENE